MVLAIRNISQLSESTPAPSSPRAVWAIVCAGVVLASLDLFIVNIALPAMARDLHQTSLGQLSWVLNAYAIVYAAALVLLGRLAEGRRRDRAYLVGVGLFTAASAACGAAPSLPVLVACRVLQALGAALLTPTSLSLLLATTPAERRQRAVRAWTATGGLAAALGPVVGGLLVALSWRWVFFVNVPIGALALLLGWRWLPHVPGHAVPRPDALGALLVTVGTGALSLAVVEGDGWGWTSWPTLAAIFASLSTLALFARRCRRHPAPLVEPRLFLVPGFRGASLVGLAFSGSFGAMLLSRVLWCQDVWGWSALVTGLGLAPGPLMVPLVSSLLAGRAIQRWGPGPTVAAGCALFAAGVLWWALAVGPKPDYVGDLLGGTILTGAGVGLTLPTVMATATSRLPGSALSTGSALVNMLRQVGLALGVALLVAILGASRGAGSAAATYRLAWFVVAGGALLAGAVGLTVLAGWRGVERQRRAPASSPAEPSAP